MSPKRPIRTRGFHLEPLDVRDLPSVVTPHAELLRSMERADLSTAMARSPALVGSIQGTETITTQGYRLGGTGSVGPMGDVTVSGFLGYGGPHGATGALNGRGALTFSNAQGSVMLSMKSHGYFPLRPQNAEEIRVTVRVQSATGDDAGIRVKGTINLVNHIFLVHRGAGPIPVPFSAQINLKPMR